MLYGGSAMLGYDLIFFLLRHHDEGNNRPRVIDHLIAMSVLGTAGGFLAFNTIQGAFGGFLFVGLNVGLLSWWVMKMGNKPLAMPGAALIYYDDDVTPEEKQRFEMQDHHQILAHNMCRTPGYGLAQLSQKYEL